MSRVFYNNYLILLINLIYPPSHHKWHLFCLISCEKKEKGGGDYDNTSNDN